MRDQPDGIGGHDVIDLAVVPDFLLGTLRVEPALRRVGAGGRVESVEPRVMQALVALVEAGGTVVSRDLLIDRCWGGRIVGEDAINRCIAKVRKLADVTEPAAFTIETIAKVGYRLDAARGMAQSPAIMDRARPAPVDPTPSPGKPARARARSRLAWAALAVAVAAGLAAELWQFRAQPKWTVVGSHMLLLDGETGPRLSPDGSFLAYVVNSQNGAGRIYVKSLQGGTTLPVSAPDENADAPAWAPDSARLAYVVADPKGGPCRIMVTAFPGGTPHVAGRCRSATMTELAWQPGTQYLYFGDDVRPTPSAIFRFDLDTGRSDQVTNPQRRATEYDYSARISPDGLRLAYIRAHGLAGRAVRVRELATGAERQLDADPQVLSVDWTPDSHSLIASIPGQTGSDIIAFPLDGAPAYRVYASASGLGRLTTGPSGVLAAEMGDLRHDLARARATPNAPLAIIDPAAGLTDWPDFAPDGTLAFVSTRSGEVALWTRRPGGPPVLLVHGGAKSIARPVWSPDGTRLAFVELWKGNISVRVVTAQGEAIVSFTVPSIGFGQPNWTPDGEHLVMFDKTILRPVRIDLRNPARREPMADTIWDGIAYHGGATYAHFGLESGLWQLNDGPPLTRGRLITPDYPAERQARLAFLGDDVLVPGASDGTTLRILAQPVKGGPTRVALYAPEAASETPLAVDRRTGDVIYVSEVSVDTRIDLFTMALQ
jgi:Tol biopolymer transport system component/DNA-binding winged helix-turn-helix (wHTH) protein